MTLTRLFATCLMASITSLSLTACGDDEPQAVNNDPVTSTDKFDVSAALKNIYEHSGNYRVSLSVGTATTRVDLTIRPDLDADLNGETVKVSKTINQTTAPSGFVSEATTLTQWDTNPANDGRVRIRRLEAVEAGRVTDVTFNANLPEPVSVGTNGSFYDGAVNEGTLRIGVVEVRWAVEPSTVDRAWVCTVGSSNFNSITSKECFLVNAAGELQGQYRAESTDGTVRLVFQ